MVVEWFIEVARYAGVGLFMKPALQRGYVGYRDSSGRARDLTHFFDFVYEVTHSYFGLNEVSLGHLFTRPYRKVV